MESKRQYRDAPGDSARLPREVYYRCLWTVRDMSRLEALAAFHELSNRPDGLFQKSGFENAPDNGPDHPEEHEIRRAVIISDEVAGRAAYETECIRRALDKIPSVYREGLLDNIINKTRFDDFAHPNTWKRWKLVFLYELAKELYLI